MTKPKPKPQPSKEKRPSEKTPSDTSMKIAGDIALAIFVPKERELQHVAAIKCIARALDERGKAEYKLGYEAGRFSGIQEQYENPLTFTERI